MKTQIWAIVILGGAVIILFSICVGQWFSLNNQAWRHTQLQLKMWQRGELVGSLRERIRHLEGIVIGVNATMDGWFADMRQYAATTEVVPDPLARIPEQRTSVGTEYTKTFDRECCRSQTLLGHNYHDAGCVNHGKPCCDEFTATGRNHTDVCCMGEGVHNG